jgi:hypothetical protein
MTDQQDDMVQAIVERNRKEAKREEEKAMMIGAAIGAGAFHLAVMLGIVHLPAMSGINLYRTAGIAACGALGAVIGRWIARPRAKR